MSRNFVCFGASMLIIEPSHSAISGGMSPIVVLGAEWNVVGVAADLHHVGVTRQRPEARSLREVAPRAAAPAPRRTSPGPRRAAWRRCLRGRAASIARCRRARSRRAPSPSWGSGPPWLCVADVGHERRHALGVFANISPEMPSIVSIVHGLSLSRVGHRPPAAQQLHLAAHDLHDLTGHAVGEIRREPADDGRDVLGCEAVELAFLGDS